MFESDSSKNPPFFLTIPTLTSDNIARGKMARVPPDVALVERENFLGSLSLHHLPAARSWNWF